MLTPDDHEYVVANFLSLADIAQAQGEDVERLRRLIADGGLPQPSYVLEDGTEMVPADYLVLAEEAGGTKRLREAFVGRYRRAAAEETIPLDEPENEWRAYLTGEYGVCLRTVTPETIVRKSALTKTIEGLLAAPRREDDDWRLPLRRSVEELDALERPFAPHYDRKRFGGPSSRDRLITAVHAEYPEIFAQPATLEA